MPVSTTVATTLNALILILFLFIAIMRAVFVSSIQEVHKGFPQPAVEWLKANKPEGRMFNAYNWGGYLQWELPEYPVYIDGRADLFGEKIIADWWTVVNGHKEAIPILDRWEVQFVILEPGWPILETLSEKGWHVRYRDELSVIMERP